MPGREENKRSTVLIVDDTEALADVLDAMLNRVGYNTIVAYNSHDCLNILKSKKPDLILLDVMMEPVDGWETLSQIKNNTETSDIPVLMLTAKALLPQELNDYGTHIEGYLVKPVHTNMLKESIQTIFNRKIKIRSMIEKAEAAGAEQHFINRYADLANRIEVMTGLVNLLRETYFPNIKNTEILDDNSEFGRIIQNIEENIAADKLLLGDLKQSLCLPEDISP